MVRSYPSGQCLNPNKGLYPNLGIGFPFSVSKFTIYGPNGTEPNKSSKKANIGKF